MKQIIRIAYKSITRPAKFVPAEVSSCGRFAIHPRVEGGDLWVLTHVPTGHCIISCCTEDQARTAILAFERLTNPGWSEANPLLAHQAVAAEGVALRRALGHQQFSERPRWTPEEAARWAAEFVPPITSSPQARP